LTTAQFVRNVVLLSEGKRESFATASTKWLRIVDLGNFFLQEFVKERGVDWNFYYDPAKSFGTITATSVFNTPSTVQKISNNEQDPIRITHTDATYTDYTLIDADRLKDHTTGNYVAKVGSTIKFNKTFAASDPQFGGTITAGVYEYPDTFSADADVIDHPNPNWLVYTVAGDRVKNDVTRKDLRSDLLAQANEAMLAMKEDNEAQLSEPIRNNFFIQNDSDIFGGQ
jgi:hypothetical protein